jgi:polysaccharide export outer membrane protein
MIELTERLPPDEPPPPMTLGAGDILEVSLSGSEIKQEILRIEVDGRLYVGPARVLVAGKTLTEASSACEDALRPWFRDPQVDLRPMSISSGKITVLGMVLKPGVFPLVGGERTLDILGMCGGSMKSSEFTDSEELADLTGALYIRQGLVLPVDLEALFKRGDVRHYIYIPPANERTVLVLGAVNSPGIVDLREGMGLAAVIGRAGGYTEDTYLDWALVIRGSRAKPMVARLDLAAILAGTGPDVPLKPGDIVYLPGRDDESPRRFIDDFNNGFVGAFTAAWANDVYNRVRGK